MKKTLLTVTMMLTFLTSYAQFTTYEPVIVDRNGNWVNRNESMNSNRNNSYNNNNYYNYNTPLRSQQQQQSQIISTRGYYIKNNMWNSVLLRVKVVGEDVYVVGIKRSVTGWSNESTRAYSTELMQKEIKDNFNYYIGDYGYGRIYF